VNRTRLRFGCFTPCACPSDGCYWSVPDDSVASQPVRAIPEPCPLWAGASPGLSDGFEETSNVWDPHQTRCPQQNGRSPSNNGSTPGSARGKPARRLFRLTREQKPSATTAGAAAPAKRRIAFSPSHAAGLKAPLQVGRSLMS